MNTKINESVFNKFPLLESDRLVFRQFEMSDAQDLFEIRSDKITMQYMDKPLHKSVEDAEMMIGGIRKSFEEKRGVSWAIIERETNRLIGNFGFWKLEYAHCGAEIGYALTREFVGKGLMSETLHNMINFGFKNLQVHRIEANINPKNISSIKLLEKVGFIQEALFRDNYFFEGSYYDSAIFSLIETDV